MIWKEVLTLNLIVFTESRTIGIEDDTNPALRHIREVGHAPTIGTTSEKHGKCLSIHWHLPMREIIQGVPPDTVITTTIVIIITTMRATPMSTEISSGRTTPLPTKRSVGDTSCILKT